MSEKTNYGAQAIAEDLENLGEEIATDTERTLDETHPREFDFDEWAKMREAIKAMREKLDEMVHQSYLQFWLYLKIQLLFMICSILCLWLYYYQ